MVDRPLTSARFDRPGLVQTLCVEHSGKIEIILRGSGQDREIIVAAIKQLGVTMAGEIDALVVVVNAVAEALPALTDAVAPLPGAVNDMEAAITALKNSGGLTAADAQKLTDATAKLQGVAAGIGKATTDVATAVADAKDGVDEAAAGPGPTPT